MLKPAEKSTVQNFSLKSLVTFKRLAGSFRQLGLRAGLLYIMQYLLRPLNPVVALFVYELVEQPVAAAAGLPARHQALVRWSEVGPDSPEVAQMPPAHAVKQMRFAQGARCIAVYRKSDFIGYVWFCFRQYEEDEVRCVYLLDRPTNSAFDFDFYIFPEFRLGRAFGTMWDAGNEFLRANGVTNTYSRISRFNLASRQAHARLGARVVGRALFFRVGPIELSWSGLSSFPFFNLTVADSVQLHL